MHDIFKDQNDKVDNLEKAETPNTFPNQRAVTQYIGVNSRPDICASVKLIAPERYPTTIPEYKSFSKILKFLRSSKHDVLSFVILDMSTVKLIDISDASFANAQGMRRQLEYIILMEDWQTTVGAQTSFTTGVVDAGG